MTIDENLIDETLAQDLAAADGPTTIRPLSEITSRAHDLRRRRRFGVVGAASAVAGLAVTAASLHLIGPDPSARRISQPASHQPAPTVKDCSLGFSGKLLPADVPDILFLPPKSVAGPVAFGPTLSRDKPNCDRPLIQASWYATKNHRITRTLNLYGPNIADPYAAHNALETAMDDSGPRTVNINGSRATFYYSTGAREGKMFWTTKDGQKWQAVVNGMLLNQAIAAIRSIVINGAHLPAGQTPDGLPITQRVLSSGFEPSKNAELYVSFVTGGEDAGGWGISVDRPLKGNLSPLPGDHRVDINGTTGWWSDTGVSDFTHQAMGFLSWTLPNGSLASIHGTISRQKAIRMARSMVQVSPDDPRMAKPVAP